MNKYSIAFNTVHNLSSRHLNLDITRDTPTKILYAVLVSSCMHRVKFVYSAICLLSRNGTKWRLHITKVLFM
jgi:hypothetical protein